MEGAATLRHVPIPEQPVEGRLQIPRSSVGLHLAYAKKRSDEAMTTADRQDSLLTKSKTQGRLDHGQPGPNTASSLYSLMDVSIYNTLYSLDLDVLGLDDKGQASLCVEVQEICSWLRTLPHMVSTDWIANEIERKFNDC